MTFSELRSKDVICIGDGRVLGRVKDIEFEPADGRIRALIVPCNAGLGCMLRGEKEQTVIAWQHVACIGDDVILISPGGCRP